MRGWIWMEVRGPVVSGSFGTSQLPHHYASSTMAAKINSSLAVHLLSGWKANVSILPLTLSVNNIKSQGTQTPVRSLISVKTWLVYAFSKHKMHTNTHPPNILHKQSHKGMQVHMQASRHIMTCLHWCTWHSYTHTCTHFSTPNIPASSLSSLWQPVCQRRNASLDYSFLSYSLVVVLGSSQGCWLADSVADRN